MSAKIRLAMLIAGLTTAGVFVAQPAHAQTPDVEVRADLTVPSLLGYEWPINREHAVASGEACKAAIASVPLENRAKALQSCVETYTLNASRPPAYY